jgi:hypothetical protein
MSDSQLLARRADRDVWRCVVRDDVGRTDLDLSTTRDRGR